MTKKINTMVEELMAKVNAGEMDLATALTQAAEMATKKATQPRVDHIAEAQSATAITDLAVLYKKAAAKMSSAKRRAGLKYETDPSYLKYKAEFEAVKARKNELYASTVGIEDEVEAAIKVGSSDNAIVQAFLNYYKDKYTDEALKIKARKNLTNQEFHAELNKMPTTAPQSLLDKLDSYREGLSQVYLKRNGNDQFVIKLNRLANYIEANSKKTRKTKEVK